jgi:Family of unknown function (DUF5670)
MFSSPCISLNRGITRDFWNKCHQPLRPNACPEENTVKPSMEFAIMIYTIISLLFAFWLIGLVAHIGGGFIHTLLVLALVVFVFDLLTGRSASV